MTRGSWSSGVVGSVVGGLYGAVLLLLAIRPMAGGHGTYLPLAVFGAPFSLLSSDWVGFVAVPLHWAIVGTVFGVTRSPLVPGLVLLVHLSGVGAVLAWGSRYELGEEQWYHFERAQLHVASGIGVALTTYLVGQVAAWGLVAARWLVRHRRLTDR